MVDGMQEVVGSSPTSSIGKSPANRPLAASGRIRLSGRNQPSDRLDCNNCQFDLRRDHGAPCAPCRREGCSSSPIGKRLLLPREACFERVELLGELAWQLLAEGRELLAQKR
jgi:hypothetical protein